MIVTSGRLIREGLKALTGALLTYGLIAQLVLGAAAGTRHAADIAQGLAKADILCVTQPTGGAGPDGVPSRHDGASDCCVWGCSPGLGGLPPTVALLSPPTVWIASTVFHDAAQKFEGPDRSGRPQQPRAPPRA